MSQDPELSAQTPFSEHFMAPAAGDPDAVLAHLKAIHKTLESQSVKGRFLDTVRNGQTDAAGYLTLALPVCPKGFRDRILSNYLGGLYYSQSAPGIAVAFITSSLPGVTDVGIPTSLVRDQTATIPSPAFYDLNQMVVHEGSFFAVQVYDSTIATAQYAWHVSWYREPLVAVGHGIV